MSAVAEIRTDQTMFQDRYLIQFCNSKRMENYYRIVTESLITILFGFFNSEITIHAQGTQFAEARLKARL